MISVFAMEQVDTMWTKFTSPFLLEEKCFLGISVLCIYVQKKERSKVQHQVACFLYLE